MRSKCRFLSFIVFVHSHSLTSPDIGYDYVVIDVFPVVNKLFLFHIVMIEYRIFCFIQALRFLVA